MSDPGVLRKLARAARAVAPKAAPKVEDIYHPPGSPEREENFARFLSGSKIRNDEGDPLRLYHITKGDFNEFVPGGSVDPKAWESGPATWLSPYPDKQPAAHQVGGYRGDDGERVFRSGTNVMPVHAAIKNPLIIDDATSYDWARKVFADDSAEFPQLLSPQTRARMLEDGYDGIVYAGPSSTRATEAFYGSNAIGTHPDREEEIISLLPNSLKSAIGNRGTYDPMLPDINKAEGGPVEMETGGGVLRKLIRAYHGSPYAFDKFDPTKIGSGEGAQAYGYGHYFTDKEEIARGYRDRLGGLSPAWLDPTTKQRVNPFTLAQSLPPSVGASDADIFKITDALSQYRNNMFTMGTDPQGILHSLDVNHDPKVVRQVMDHLTQKSELGPSGHMYDVNLGVNPQDLLNWDAPLSTQSKGVREILGDFGYKADPEGVLRHDDALLAALTNPAPSLPLPAMPPDPMGYSIYGGRRIAPGGHKADVSDALRERGIPGIRYLDGFSRGAGEGTSNYVMFPGTEDLININRRYEQGGPVEMAGGGPLRKLAKALKQELFPSSNPKQDAYLRFGEWPENERSQNFIGGDREAGVSVYPLAHERGVPHPAVPEGEWTLDDYSDRLRDTKTPRWLVEGDQVGLGGDGEPLLRDVRRLGEYGQPYNPLTSTPTERFADNYANGGPVDTPTEGEGGMYGAPDSMFNTPESLAAALYPQHNTAYGGGGPVDTSRPSDAYFNDPSVGSYRPLNFESLVGSGAARITQPGNGRDGGHTASDDPEQWSLVTHANDTHPDSVTRAWPDKPSAHGSAFGLLNDPGALYAGKYRQLLWSAKQRGMADKDIYLPSEHYPQHDTAYGGGGKVLRKVGQLARDALLGDLPEYRPGEETYLRFGKWPENERSRNYIEGGREEGVSVYPLAPHGGPPLDWSDSGELDSHRYRHLKGSVFPYSPANPKQDHNHPRFLVQGREVGIGQDGEPLLREVKPLSRDWHSPQVGDNEAAPLSYFMHRHGEPLPGIVKPFDDQFADGGPVEMSGGGKVRSALQKAGQLARDALLGDLPEYKPGEETYLRFGKWPENERSQNFITGDRERGVSVFGMEPSGLPESPNLIDTFPYRMSDHLSSTHADDPLHLVQGRPVGEGYDGEPLIQDITRLPTTWHRPQRWTLPAQKSVGTPSTDWSQFESFVKPYAGDYADGGPVHMELGGILRRASRLGDMMNEITNRHGASQGRRFEQASDSANLEHFSDKGLLNAFGSRSPLLTTMPPGRFEDFATPIPDRFLHERPYYKWGYHDDADMLSPGQQTYDEYLRELRNVSEYGGGLSEVPYLRLRRGLPFNEVGEHEGRHRQRMLAEMGEPNSLVQLLPGDTSRGLQEGRVERLMKHYFLHGNETPYMPEKSNVYDSFRPMVQFPNEVFAEGGPIEMSTGGQYDAPEPEGAGYIRNNVGNMYAGPKDLVRGAKALGKAVKESPYFAPGTPERDANYTRFMEGSHAPPRVYHGTTSPDDFPSFSVGDPHYTEDASGEFSRRIGSGADPTTYLGSHFAEEPEIANRFAAGLYGEREGADIGNRVYPVHLRATNPYITSDSELMSRMMGGRYDHPHIEDELTHQATRRGISFEDADQLYVNDPVFRSDVNNAAVSGGLHYDDPDTSLAEDMAARLRADLTKAGHDSVKYKNEIEGGNSWIAFTPKQIKSAIGNRGTYDLTLPDMNHSHGGPIEMKSKGSVAKPGWEEGGTVEDQYHPIWSQNFAGGGQPEYDPLDRTEDMESTFMFAPRPWMREPQQSDSPGALRRMYDTAKSVAGYVGDGISDAAKNEWERFRGPAKYHPGLYFADAASRADNALKNATEDWTAKDYWDLVTPDMGLRHEYGPMAAPLDVAGIVAAPVMAGGRGLGKATQHAIKYAERDLAPALMKLYGASAAPVATKSAYESYGMAHGGSVEDQYHPIWSQNFEDGGPVEMAFGGGFAPSGGGGMPWMSLLQDGMSLGKHIEGGPNQQEQQSGTYPYDPLSGLWQMTDPDLETYDQGELIGGDIGRGVGSVVGSFFGPFQPLFREGFGRIGGGIGAMVQGRFGEGISNMAEGTPLDALFADGGPVKMSFGGGFAPSAPTNDFTEPGMPSFGVGIPGFDVPPLLTNPQIARDKAERNRLMQMTEQAAQKGLAEQMKAKESGGGGGLGGMLSSLAPFANMIPGYGPMIGAGMSMAGKMMAADGGPVSHYADGGSIPAPNGEQPWMYGGGALMARGGYLRGHGGMNG